MAERDAQPLAVTLRRRPLKHPALFTAREAATYLHLDGVATLDWLCSQQMLQSYKVGKRKLYWRQDLDDCAKRIVGEVVPPRAKLKPLKLAE